MPFDFLTFVRRFMFEEKAAISSIAQPVLVCEAPPAGDDEALMETRSAADLRRRSGATLVFELRKSNAKMNAFALGITVGRTENNDVHLDESTVSRFHAYFTQDPRTQGWKLMDAESSNGTWVGTQRLVPKMPVEISDGALIKFGEVMTQFFLPGSFIDYTRKQLRK